MFSPESLFRGFCGFYGDGFGGAQIRANAAFVAGSLINELRLLVFALL
jgi:hypothetical protein